MMMMMMDMELMMMMMKSGSIINAVIFQCSQCDFNFKTEEDLNAHIDDMHTSPTLPTPEKERAPDQIADPLLTPIHGQRKEKDTIPSLPPFSVVCDMHVANKSCPKN